MLNAFWNGFVIIVTLLSIAGCWWLLQWTKGISNRDGDGIGTTGHVWDEDLEELNNPLPRWWLYLFHGTIVFTLVYFVLYPSLGNFAGTLGWSQEGQYDEQITAARANQQSVYEQFAGLSHADLSGNEAAMDIGRNLFANNCAMCHGSDGAGASGFPDLTDDDWLYGSDPEAVSVSIRNGRNGMMPALAPALGDEGIEQVSAFVLSLTGNEGDAALIDAGAQKYTMFCAACHGPDGSGNQTLGAPNLADDIWLYGFGADRIAEAITLGRSGNMPAHDNVLSEEQIRIVAAYVSSLSAP